MEHISEARQVCDGRRMRERDREAAPWPMASSMRFRGTSQRNAGPRDLGSDRMHQGAFPVEK